MLGLNSTTGKKLGIWQAAQWRFWFGILISGVCLWFALQGIRLDKFWDALRAVDLVRPTDPLKGDADRLKAGIQRELLAHRTSPGGMDTSASPNGGDPSAP